ncbi:hypothetical protein MASR2M79_22650 [Aminivibrio sp.]
MIRSFPVGARRRGFEGDSAVRMDLKVTYYAAEYIEALVRQEAEKNLWTADETENSSMNC